MADEEGDGHGRSHSTRGYSRSVTREDPDARAMTTPTRLVLIVDDNASKRIALRSVLLPLGLAVLLNSGIRATAHARPAGINTPFR